MTDTLESWRHGDPLQVMLRQEAESCKGCKFEVTEAWFGQKLHRCGKDKKYGKRCGKYISTEKIGSQ